MTDEDRAEWYAVRCVFRTGWPPRFAGKAYEERITLWQAASFEEAIERAEAEARNYAAAITDGPHRYVGIAQAYHLFDTPADGAEVFSLIRKSRLKPKAYLDRFFDTGKERQRRT
jgi:hypothetical protein